jgi:hypothetical protein
MTVERRDDAAPPSPDDEWGEVGDAAAQRIAHALIGERALPAEIERWRDALRAHDVRLRTSQQRQLWRVMQGAPWLIGLLDGGLALTRPESPVRHRLLLMLAVLEASPAHTRRFLPREISPPGLALLVARGAAAGMRAALGFVLLRMFGLVEP